MGGQKDPPPPRRTPVSYGLDTQPSALAPGREAMRYALLAMHLHLHLDPWLAPGPYQKGMRTKPPKQLSVPARYG